MSPRRRLLMAAGLATVVGALLTGPGLVSPTGALEESAATGFFGSATGDGVKVLAESPGAPASDRVIDVGVLSASATLDSLGNSVGYAASVYPGEVVLNGPGLLAGLFGVPTSVPPYPLIVESAYPARSEAESHTGPTTLRASSRQNRAESSATSSLGTGFSSATSYVERDPESATVTVKAENITEGVSFGDILTIGRVRSTAMVTQQPGNELERRSTLEVSAVTVGGVAVGVTSDGVIIAGQSMPFPGGHPSRSPEETLRSAGIQVRSLQPIDTPSGVIAAALQVTTTLSVPGGPAPVTITYRFGQAAASGAAGTVTRTDGGAVDFGQPTAGEGSAEFGMDEMSSAIGSLPPDQGAGWPAVRDAGGSPAEAPNLGEVRRSSTAAGPAVGEPAPPAATPRAVPWVESQFAALPRARPLGVASGLLPSRLAGGIYALVAIGGLVTFVGAGMFRSLPRRSPWKS